MMEPFKILLTISVFASLALSSIAAPATVSSQANLNKINIRETPLLEEEVTTLERFFRVYEDGTIEFKIVLSNGLAQYLKITNKSIGNNKTIQVQKGYNSERLPDNTYRTSYYIADENGYRLLRREFDTKPPVLPVYVPYVPKVSAPGEYS